MIHTEVLVESQNLVDIFAAALVAVDPYNAVLNAARVERDQLHIAGVKPGRMG